VPLEEKAEGENLPVSVLLQFQNFKIEQKLQRSIESESAASAGGAQTTAATEPNRGNNP